MIQIKSKKKTIVITYTPADILVGIKSLIDSDMTEL